MKQRTDNRECGQSIVLVVIMFLGMIAMLALVLDGGNLLTQRRAAQVAADAGALAGAREYCITENKTAAINRGYEYAVTRNEADNATVTVDSATGDVTVDASITFDAFFLGLLGRPQLIAVATATAGCDPASSAYVMPVAWSCRPPTGESESEDCDLFYWNTADGVDDCVLGDYIYMIVDSADAGDELICLDPSQPPPANPAYPYVDCDMDDDGVDDLQLLSGGNRSWLDLDGGGGGAADLKDWIANGMEEPIYPHTWFAGQTGVAVSVYDAVYDNILDDQVVIPVFDEICPDGEPFSNCPAQVHPEDTVMGDGGASTDYFHVISFALFVPTCVNAGGHKHCPAHDNSGLSKDIKTIEGCFVEGIDAYLGSGGGTVDTGADVVYLKR